MSRAEEFRRLMLHAAKRLEVEDDSVQHAFTDAVCLATNDIGRTQRLARCAGYVAASTYAQAVLEMVASFLVDDEPEATP